MTKIIKSQAARDGVGMVWCHACDKIHFVDNRVGQTVSVPAPARHKIRMTSPSQDKSEYEGPTMSGALSGAGNTSSESGGKALGTPRQGGGIRRSGYVNCE